MRKGLRVALDEDMSQLINFYTNNPYLIPMALGLGKTPKQMYAAAAAKQILTTGKVTEEDEQFEKSEKPEKIEWCS